MQACSTRSILSSKENKLHSQIRRYRLLIGKYYNKIKPLILIFRLTSLYHFDEIADNFLAFAGDNALWMELNTLQC